MSFIFRNLYVQNANYFSCIRQVLFSVLAWRVSDLFVRTLCHVEHLVVPVFVIILSYVMRVAPTDCFGTTVWFNAANFSSRVALLADLNFILTFSLGLLDSSRT